MKTTIYFDMAVVAKLIRHASNATGHSGTYAQCYDENFKLIKNPAIPPGLIWVKDSGIYLLSNGKLPEGDTPESTGLICYAVGYDPNTNPDYHFDQATAVGGDDFAEHIELEWLGKEIPTYTDGYFFLEVSPEQFRMGWAPEME